MMNQASISVKFLSWGSPWPPHGGASLRSLGLLREIARAFEVELLVLSRQPLSAEQKTVLNKCASSVTRVPLRDASLRDKMRAIRLMLRFRFPYHSAVLVSSFDNHGDELEGVLSFPGVVYASFGHWGTLVLGRRSPGWILDQHNADVEFWRVYASQASSFLRKLAALVNWRLSDRHFRSIYQQVGHIISVCEEDKQLTLDLAPDAQVDVIQNGVDCSYYVPNKPPRTGPPQLLFTGTSAPRNMTALHQFMRNVFPSIKTKVPDVELLVAGNFHLKAQAEFRKYPDIRFTGCVDDIRPAFNGSDVYVAPFENTHGSKLKIAEAMAMEMPTVSTPAGIRGFPLIDGESVLIGHDDEQFAAHVVALLANPLRRKSLGTAAREVALSTIDWRVLGKRLIAIIESVHRQG